VSAAEQLLRWYRGECRDLPWRRTRDPWAIWVSEVMLQQTRVDHAVPYYLRFLARYPDPATLAAAPIEEALALWSGLGYYRRLRLLHRAAGEVVARGGIPRDLAGLRSLPGVGDYTAAAVGSIAFGLAVPVLDGNVERVVCRLLGEAEAPGRAAVDRRLRAAAGELLVAGAAGESNQALMELGALVCLPRAPRCPRCPLAGGCAARRSGAPERLPVRPVRRAPQQMRLVVACVERAGRLLLFRRDEGAPLLAGTWELPWVEGEPGDEAERALLARYGCALRLTAPRGEVRHAITFRRLRAAVWAAMLGDPGDALAGSPASAVGEGREAAWFTAAEIAALPVSSLVHKALRRAATAGAAEMSNRS
jgi:A/G-specific adenine glycosylase